MNRRRKTKITNTESVFEASQKAALRSTKVRMEIEPESQAVRRSLKTRELYMKKESGLEGVPKIVLIKMTKKLVRNNFLSKVGHK